MKVEYIAADKSNVDGNPAAHFGMKIHPAAIPERYLERILKETVRFLIARHR